MDYFLKDVGDYILEIYCQNELFLYCNKKNDNGFFNTLVTTSVKIDGKEIVFKEKTSPFYRKCKIEVNQTETNLALRKRSVLMYDNCELKVKYYGFLYNNYRIELNGLNVLTYKNLFFNYKFSTKIKIEDNININHKILLAFVCFLEGDITYG